MFVAALFIVAGLDVERSEIGPLRIEIVKPARIVGLDDPLVLQLTIQFPPTVAVEPPNVNTGDTLDSALVTAVGVEGPDRIDGPFGTIVVANWTLTLKPTKVGSLTPPKLRTRYREKGKDPVPVEIAMPDFEVRPGKIAVGPHEPLRLPPPLPPMEDRPNLAWWLKAVGGVALLLCVTGLAWHGFRASSTKTDGET